MLRNHLFHPPLSSRDGVGLGTLGWHCLGALSPQGTSSDLKLLNTRQVQASRGSPDGATEQQSTHARSRVPALTCMLTHSYKRAGWCQQV